MSITVDPDTATGSGRETIERGPTGLKRFMLGSMVGDSIGLPFEGLGRRRVVALLRTAPLAHRLVFGRGMISDDTEHMVMTVAAWWRAAGDARTFARHLARSLRLWLLAIPPATGMATARASIKLLAGVPPHRSGVRSAGNGPAMRAGVLGLLCTNEDDLLAFVQAATRITHTDDRAEHGALAIALAARATRLNDGPRPAIDSFFASLDRLLPDGEMRGAIDGVRESVANGQSTEEYARSIGCEKGVTGFVMHTVPVVLHLWMSNPPSFRDGICRVIALGGDTDTTAAILGGLLGMQHGESGIPGDWLSGIKDFPVTPSFVARMADAIEAGEPVAAGPALRWAAQLPRNLLFLGVVLAHALRRLAPPYR